MFEAWLPLKTPLERLMWLKRRIGGGASWVWRTITGAAPLTLANAVSHAIHSLTQYGLCTQATTPTPSDPVDIVCNNGAIKYGWYDIITTSSLSGYGTYVSPSSIAGNRAYKWFKDLPNGTYTFAVDGDYELIVQWRDPADPSVLIPSAYENLSGWMTSGEVVLDKEGGGYGIAVRRTSGTSSITPSNFDGTLHVQERGLFVDGAPEVLSVGGKNLNGGTIENKGYTSTGGESTSTTFAGTLWKIPCKEGDKFTVSWDGFPDGVSGVFINTWLTDGTWNARQAISASTSLTYTVGAGVGIINFTLYKTGGITIGDNAWLQVEYGTAATDYEPYVEPQTVTDIPMLLAVGDYADEGEIISGIKTGKIGVKVLDGTEAWVKGTSFYADISLGALESRHSCICSHFVGKSTDGYTGDSNTIQVGYSADLIFWNRVYITANRTTYATAADFKAWLASEYANGTPVIVVYPLATETTEQGTPHALHTSAGTNVVDVMSNVDPVNLSVEYASTQVGFGFGNPNEQENEGEGNE